MEKVGEKVEHEIQIAANEKPFAVGFTGRIF